MLTISEVKLLLDSIDPHKVPDNAYARLPATPQRSRQHR